MLVPSFLLFLREPMTAGNYDYRMTTLSLTGVTGLKLPLWEVPKREWLGNPV